MQMEGENGDGRLQPEQIRLLFGLDFYRQFAAFCRRMLCIVVWTAAPLLLAVFTFLYLEYGRFQPRFFALEGTGQITELYGLHKPWVGESAGKDAKAPSS